MGGLPIQLTGTKNHNACADFFGIPRDAVGEWLATDEGAALSAGWFWHTNNLNCFADVDDVDGISDCVNIGRKTNAIGDAIGFEDRRFLTDQTRKVIA